MILDIQNSTRFQIESREIRISTKRTKKNLKIFIFSNNLKHVQILGCYRERERRVNAVWKRFVWRLPAIFSAWGVAVALARTRQQLRTAGPVWFTGIMEEKRRNRNPIGKVTAHA